MNEFDGFSRNRGSPNPDESGFRPGGDIVPRGEIYPALSPLGPGGETVLGRALPPEPVTARPQCTLRDILRHKWTLLGVTVLITVPTIVAIWTLIALKYEAKAKVRVSPIIPRLVFRTEDNGRIHLYEGYMKTQISVIRSPAALQEVLKTPEVMATSWYDQGDPFWRVSERSRLERLLVDISVKRQRGTELIEVAIATRIRSDGAVVVNAVLDQYIKYVSEKSDEVDNLLFHQLIDQFNKLTEEIEDREKVVASLRKQLGTSDPEELVGRKRVRLDDLQAELDSRRRILSTAQWRHEQLKKQLNIKDDAPSDPLPVQDDLREAYQGDPEWRRLYQDVQMARYNAEVEGGQLGEAHPRRLALLKRVALAENLLRQHESLLERQQQFSTIGAPGAGAPGAQADNWQIHLLTYAPRSLAQELRSTYAPRSLSQELGATKWQIKLLTFEEKVLKEDMEKHRLGWAQTFEKAEDFAKQLKGLNQKKQLHEAVRIRLEQKSMERNVPASVEVLARAFEPTSPARDRRGVLTMLAMFFGLVGGVGSAFLRARSNPPISQADELTCPGMVPFLGQVPRVAVRRKRFLLNNPLVKEGIRMVRTPLLRRIDTHQGNVVLITSPGPSEGKTTVAVMLGRSLAQCGRNVLLVDADMRNPSVSAHLGIDSKMGFADALSGDADDDKIIVKSDIPGLSILPARPLDNGANLELISNGAFSAAARRWSKRYDVVLLDSPPVLPVADARILARESDGTVLVVWAERTRRTDAIDALACLDAAGGKLWGTVFVGALRRHHYGRGYNYGYGVVH